MTSTAICSCRYGSLDVLIVESGPGPEAPGHRLGQNERADAPPLASLDQLELVDFRCFSHAVVQPDPTGVTVLNGPNGSGKTSILEAVGYLARLRSLRGVPRDALVRTGSQRAYVRGELTAGHRQVLIEAEIGVAGRSRTQVNRQAIRSRRVLAENVVVSTFSPNDLELVQGGPSWRRDFMDDAAATLDPRAAAAQDDYERAVRQRNAALRQCNGRPDPSIDQTLDVWDQRLGQAGSVLGQARRELLADLQGLVNQAYQVLSRGQGQVRLEYQASWDGPLTAALAATRKEDLRRGTTSVGLHHDDLQVLLAGRDARQQASQGEQRCVALSLRLGVHQLVASRRQMTPILLLDDVFSELDPARTRALVEAVPPGQTLLTTASPVPPDLRVARVIDVATLHNHDDLSPDLLGKDP